MNKLDQLNYDIEIAEQELKDIETMTEEQACDLYSCDFKEEAVTLLNEELTSLRSELQTEIERLESILDDIHRLVDFTELNEAISMWQRMEAGLIRRKEIMVENWLE